MGDLSTKRTQALEACDKVINGIEDGTITTSSALLLCMKIARLVGDSDAQMWLSFEFGGYPRDDKGYLTSVAWDTAADHGRSFIDQKDKKRYVFSELAAELEESIRGSRAAVGNYTTQGFSVSGDLALLATDRMALRVAQSTNDLLQSSKTNEKRLSILKSQYYDYAVRWQIDLQFGKTAKKVFEEYQEKVSLYFSGLSTTTLQKLSAIEELMEDGKWQGKICVQRRVDNASFMVYTMCSGRSVPPLKQGLCWKVLVEALIGLCGLQVPTRWFTENKNTHV